MKTIFEIVSNIIGKGRLMKLLFNLSPMYRRTGGRIITVSNDLRFVRIKLPLNYKTRNYVGTLYGGHMYSCVDGIYMVQLINLLGSEYVVWDKSATIAFRRPGKTTLFADFRITNQFLEHVICEITDKLERDFKLQVDLKDQEGQIYAEIEKVIYIAKKEFYEKKKKQQRILVG